MYFSNLNKVEEIKKAYRKLCFKHHPDRGGDTAIMQEINSQYKKALQSVDGQKQTGSDGQEHTYYYNADIEQSLMDKISQLLSYKMADIEIALIGTWIWILGNTKPYKSVLGKDGACCRWHTKRKCWYWHEGKHRSRDSKYELSDLAVKYGFKRFVNGELQTSLAH